MRFWQIDGYKPDFRGDLVSKFLREKNLRKFSILDVACGYGHVLDEIKKEIPECEPLGIDITKYYEWELMSVPLVQKSLQELIKEDKHYDVVMMLDSYRNWEGDTKKEFDDWVSRNATYFITSGDNAPTWRSERIGQDVKYFPLYFYHVNKPL